MRTITAILEPHADESLRLPLPPELRHTAVKLTAAVEPAVVACPRCGCRAGRIQCAPDFDESPEDFKETLE
jgi:hypothetical protein